MKLMPHVLTLFFLAGVSHAAEAPLVSIPPGPNDNFSVATFHLRIPEAVQKPRYVLVLLPGFNGNGAGLVNNKQWLGFAEQTRGAVLAFTFKSMAKDQPGRRRHCAAAQYGSGAALESALERFDRSVPGLSRLPLLIYGHSAGGQYAFGFSCHNPDRTIGFAAAKGGYYFPEPKCWTDRVPGLMISGERDLARRRVAIRELFERFRARGVPWCWLEDSGDHGGRQHQPVVIAYFRELLRQQLNESGHGLDRAGLRGVRVDLRGKQNLGAGATAGTDPRQGWLPSAEVFDAWAQVDVGAAKYTGTGKSAE